LIISINIDDRQRGSHSYAVQHEEIAMTSGLEGIVAAETALSHVDGAAGRLVIRGRALAELARDHGFEGTTGLLWSVALPPERTTRAAVAAALGAARVAAWPLVPRVLAASAGLNPVAALRVGLAMLSAPADSGAAASAVGAIPVLLAAILRGKDLIAPDPARMTAGDFLRMLHGREPDPAPAAALDTYLTVVSDHGLNASTFTARVIASTNAGVVPAVVGALAALEGPLHGGAPGPVLDMLDAIAASGDAAAWLAAKLAAGERLMGFGHRVYRTRDPRADVLKEAAARLGKDAGRIAFAESVEAASRAALARHRPGRRLDTNVEFYTAILLEALGLPRAAFTAIFAMGRAAGWTAHVMEQEATGRLIRPDSRYIGPLPAAA
jgi:citrate synthase